MRALRKAMPLPATIARPALQAQWAGTEAEAMTHQQRAVYAAWAWGLDEYANRPAHRRLSASEVEARWTQLAGPGDDEDTWMVLNGGYCGCHDGAA